MKWEGITGSGLSKQIMAVEVSKLWQQRLVSIVLGLRKKQRKCSTETQGWPELWSERHFSGSWNHQRHRYHQKSSLVQRRCREQTQHTLSSGLPISCWQDHGNIVCRSLAYRTQSRAEKETDRTESKGFPGRNHQPPALVAIIEMQFRPWRETVYKDRLLGQAWDSGTQCK